jgi:uncharacterized protein GlcG (DUF336 family)
MTAIPPSNGFSVRILKGGWNHEGEGGLPIFADGKCIGAIGVSGGKSSEDAQVGKAGVEALKLK